MTRPGRIFIVVGLCAPLSVACGGSRRAPQGPPPEYEPSPVLPWNAEQGSGKDDLDPLIENAKLPPSHPNAGDAGVARRDASN